MASEITSELLDRHHLTGHKMIMAIEECACAFMHFYLEFEDQIVVCRFTVFWNSAIPKTGWVSILNDDVQVPSQRFVFAGHFQTFQTKII